MTAPDWITAIASIIAALAAAYGVVQGIASYDESLRVRKLAALVELENSFQRTLPFFVRLEDDDVYAAEIRPVVMRSLADEDLEPSQVQLQAELDLAVRFFYIFWVRVGLLQDSAELLRPYSYYLHQIGGRPEVRAYVQRFYPGLLTNLNAAQGRRNSRD